MKKKLTNYLSITLLLGLSFMQVSCVDSLNSPPSSSTDGSESTDSGDKKENNEKKGDGTKSEGNQERRKGRRKKKTLIKETLGRQKMNKTSQIVSRKVGNKNNPMTSMNSTSLRNRIIIPMDQIISKNLGDRIPLLKINHKRMSAKY